MSTTTSRTVVTFVAALTFLLGACILLAAELALSFHLPYEFPIGGNDEPMHLSMARSIAKHLSWPRWDSQELLRFYGTSYATDASINYWFEGLSLRWTDQLRWSPRLLFVLYLLVLSRVALRDPIVALFGLAAVTPQLLFVFSYVNSDAWTVIVALLLGTATARFCLEPGRTSNVVLLFVTAAACLTCRPHMWVLGCVTFSGAVLWRIHVVLRENPKALISALIPALIIGSWWPVTSMIANDGDPIGRATNRRAIVKYAILDPPPVGLDEAEIRVRDFAVIAGESFYGQWAWGTLGLRQVQYRAALLVGLPLLAFALTRSKTYWLLFAVLMLVNGSLMYLSAERFGTAIWQGRYLYPAFFVVLGAFLEDAPRRDRMLLPDGWRWALVGLLTLFIGLNLAATRTLWTYTAAGAEAAVHLDRFERSVRLVNSGEPAEAEKLLRESIDDGAADAATFHLLGYIQMQDGRMQQAQQSLEQALAADPDSPHVALRLAQLYMRGNYPQDAINTFHLFLVRQPESIKRANEIATVWTRTGDWGAVIQFCQEVLKQNPQDRRARDVLVALQKWRQARINQVQQGW